MIIYILIALHFLCFSWAFYNLLYFGIKPSKSLSWILITLFFPFIGVLLFLLFGLNRRRLKFLKLKETKRRKQYIHQMLQEASKNYAQRLHSTKARKIAHLVYSNTNTSLSENNEVKLLKDGKTTFDAIFEAIKKAESFIHLQYYIFEDGKILTALIDLLAEKINENVEVRILYDAFGSYELKKSTRKKIKEIGAEIYPEMPLEYGKFLFTLNHRNHRKICIIDNKIGFTGGVNLSDEYIQEANMGIWQDTHIQIKGAAVLSLQKSFAKDFFFATNQDLDKQEKYRSSFEGNGKTKIQIVSGSPDYEQAMVMQQYLSLINSAEKNIYVLNPYFIPTSPILEAFKIAALSGITVTLLLPRKSDSKMATYSMFSYFEQLLNAGVTIYLRDDFSHSKVIFIDDEIASIGSTNFDCRSFEHNYELNALIFDEKITKELHEEFDKHKNKATKIDYKSFRKRSVKQKTYERFARFLSPLL